MFKFSTASKERLKSCHKDIRLIVSHAITTTPIDFGIAEGHRSLELQNKYFLQGLSKIDGIIKKGKHNTKPSLAVDIYLWIDGKISYDKESLSFVAGLIHGVSETLYWKGDIKHKVRWGGNWDMDGIILLDQSFDDRPHFELIKG
jgi:peptidoglycan L-alanyl-D-glutamate endopeptidase CwlK